MTSVKSITGAAGLLSVCSLFVSPAQAGYIVTLEQEGTSVVASGSGTIDLASLSFILTGDASPGMEPSAGIIETGPVPVFTVDVYSGISGPTSFGSGGNTPPGTASSGSGDPVGIAPVVSEIEVPTGYISGGFLTDMTTYDNQTFTTLGVTPGTYVWTWGNGATADSFTLDIIAAPVPEPPSALLFAVPLAALALLQASRRMRNSE